MKKLIISIKSASESLSQFAKRLEAARNKNDTTEPCYEISFDNRKEFNKFVRNIFILEAIQTFRPTSIYDLADKIDMDYSNLSKIIIFLEDMGAIAIRDKKSKGKLLKVPVVEYDTIEFKLKVA